MMGKKALAIVLSFILVLGSSGMVFGETAQSPAFADMPDNWSSAALNKAVENQLLKGYDEDGKMLIKANNPLTRAELAAVVNRAFACVGLADISKATDVSSTAWYASDMAKAVKMGTFALDTKMRPGDKITRQEAFAVLARAFKLTSADSTHKALDKFSDKADIAAWALNDLDGLAAAGYVQGNDGKLNPKANITRAEFAVVMDNLVKQYIDVAGTVTEVVAAGNVMVRAAGVTLKDVTVKGDLIIADGVGEGDITLDSVTVEGRTVVRGGGENSIHIIGNSNVQNIIIARVDGQVRVYAEDGTEIGTVIVDGSDDVIIEGDFKSVTVLAEDVTVVATNATITNATIEGKDSIIVVGSGSTIDTIAVNGENATITANAGAKVNDVVINANGATVAGAGTVTNVAANADDATVNTVGTVVKAAEGTSGVKAGDDAVAPGTEETVGLPPSTGGGGSKTVAVSAISVNKTAVTLAVGATETLVVTFDPTNATNKNVTWTTSDEGVATVANGVVTAVGEGTATITATSNNGKTATCAVTVEEAPVVEYEAVTNATADSIGDDFDLETINYEDLTVTQDAGNVTITGDVAIKVTADQTVKGFGKISDLIPDGAESTEFALVAWNIGDEAHVWIIGDATKKFTVTYNEVEYTIDVSGLNWEVYEAVTNATADSIGDDFDLETINYEDLTVTQDAGNVTITGDVAIKVTADQTVKGFGKISDLIPDGAESTEFALVAWNIGDEAHVWIIGDATKKFTVTYNEVEYTIDVSGLNWEVYEAVTNATADSIGDDFDLETINYEDLTVTQDAGNVTITGDVAIKVTADQTVKGFGKISDLIPDGAESTEFALVAWNIGDEAHVWIIGDATKKFTVTYNEVEYTIDVSGLNWEVYEAVTNATADSIGDDFDLETINYEDLTVTQDAGNVTITGDVAIKVTADQTVKGFGKISDLIPDGAESTEFALVAWNIGDEAHVWIIGDATKKFTVTYNEVEYTIDVSGLNWEVYEAVTNATADSIGDDFDLETINYEDLTVTQDAGNVTITGDVAIKVTADQTVKGFGKISDLIPDGAESTEFALVAWNIGDEAHVWIIGDATKKFTVTYNEVEYTIDVSGLNWEVYEAVTNATADSIGDDFDLETINYEDLTVTQDAGNVTITGDVAIKVTADQTVKGFGKISDLIPDGAESTEFALVAWNIGDEAHVWIIGDATKKFTVTYNEVEYTIDVSGLNWEVYEAVTNATADSIGDDFDLETINYEDLTVTQDAGNVTITGDVAIKVTADQTVKGFGKISDLIPDGAESTEFALVAWNIGDEAHVWIIGDATKKFTVTYNEVEYTIDVSGLNWEVYEAVTNATADSIGDDFDLETINYEDLTVTQDAGNVTITGDVAIKVTADQTVKGFGKISDLIPDGAESTEFALVAWNIGDEAHVWIIGDATKKFTVTYNEVEYTIDVSGLNWEVYEAVTNATADSIGDDFDLETINYEDLTVTQDAGNVTITGDVAIKVTADQTVKGFGKISDLIPDGAESTEFALVAWNIGDEAHVWIIGDATKKFTVTYNEVEYTIDVSGLNWEVVED